MKINLPFSGQYFTPSEAELLMKSMATYARGGQTIKSVLEALIETESGKRKKLLGEIKTIHVNRQVPLAKVFLQYKLINENEFKLMDETDDFAKAVSIILAMRSSAKKIKKVFFSITLAPVAMISAVMIASAWVSPMIVNFVSDIARRIRPGSEKMLDFSWHMTNSEYLLFLGVALPVFYIAIIFYYIYLEKNNIQKLYKIFPLKAYEDLPNIFQVIKIYSEKGMSDVLIAKNLSLFAMPKGIRSMFRIKNGRFTGFSDGLKLFNIPYDITSMFQSAERSDSLLRVSPIILNKDNKPTTPLDWLIEYCNETLEHRIVYIRDRIGYVGLKKLGTYLWASVLFAFVGTTYYSMMMAFQQMRTLANNIGAF